MINSLESNTVTYSQVQELVKRVPPASLKQVYNMIMKFTAPSVETEYSPVDFMALPLSERRKRLKEQALKMVAYYNETKAEREIWQAGDFLDETQAQ